MTLITFATYYVPFVLGYFFIFDTIDYWRKKEYFKALMSVVMLGFGLFCAQIVLSEFRAMKSHFETVHAIENFDDLHH